MVAELGGPDRVFEGVILQFHGGRPNLSLPGQRGDAQLLCLGRFARVIGQDRACGEGARHVGEHQGVLVAGEFKEVKQAFFGGQPLQEVKVGFPVLDAEFPFRVRMAQPERHIADAAFFEQGGEHGFDILLLKNP
ncbi:hypothetical protein B738_28427 [Photorhabdus temperata subsp. temperata M1021]|nr:hypothetical protein B738_28427 [Photorhabdus temperata subsp. temperata M1021]